MILPPDMCPNNPDLNRVDAPFGGYGRASLPRQEVDAVDQLKHKSDAHCHGASLIIASENGNIVCSVLCIRMADTLFRTVC